ncbi:MAG: acyltransferase family protein [Actinophytocola sp.]|nr:acyltransferase family protein [Actinophytocola sp.]
MRGAGAEAGAGAGATLTAPQPQVSGPAPAGQPAYRAYRPELQGLRALAVILVVCYHVWLGRISGGVDVFFVITGFLITGQLHRAITRGGIRFGPLWGRIIKRLFPAALTVLAGVILAGYLFLPQHRWFSTIEHVFASALYFENWQLAAESTDYFAQQNSASLPQHFWSLSIQGQFYLLMPIVVALVAFVARKAGWGLRSPLLVTMTLLFAGSLAYSVWLTATNQPLAYFHSLTRVWEFMLGGLLALSINHLVLPRGLRILLGWLGVAGLVCCGLLLQVGTVFPGYAALWPTMAAVLVLLAGATESRLGADRWLSSRPLEFLGDISYSLYLWHWPVLLMYLTVRHQEEVGLKGGAVIIVASFVLAIATYYLIEEPARRSRFGLKRTWGGYAFGAVLLVPVLLLTQGWQLHSERLATAGAVAAGDPNYPGAMAIDGGAADMAAYDAEPAPSLINLPYEWNKFSDRECEMSRRGHKMKICKTTNGATAKKRIVVVGDSHAQLYTGALDPLVEPNDWQAYSIIRGGCPFSTDSELIKESQACVDYNAALVEELREIDPDAVVTMASYQVSKGRTERTPEGFVAQWRKLASAGIPVVAFRDNPRYDFEPSACADDLGARSPRCSGVRAELYPEVPSYERIPGVPGNVRFVDLSDYFCDGPTCPPIIGNVRVYMDDNHITQTYMNTLAPVMERELTTALGW